MNRWLQLSVEGRMLLLFILCNFTLSSKYTGIQKLDFALFFFFLIVNLLNDID